MARMMGLGLSMRYLGDHAAANGFNICPPALPIGLRDFAAEVVPELRRR